MSDGEKKSRVKCTNESWHFTAIQFKIFFCFRSLRFMPSNGKLDKIRKPVGMCTIISRCIWTQNKRKKKHLFNPLQLLFYVRTIGTWYFLLYFVQSLFIDIPTEWKDYDIDCELWRKTNVTVKSCHQMVYIAYLFYTKSWRRYT